jgi:CheY-like chemotaxis protein
MANILFVDDDELVHETLGEILAEEFDHIVLSALDGLEALNILYHSQDPLYRRQDLDIVILDYNMPNLNGYQLSKEIRTNPDLERYANIPLIGVGEFPETRRRYLTEFHEKPIAYFDLQKLIEKSLSD